MLNSRSAEMDTHTYVANLSHARTGFRDSRQNVRSAGREANNLAVTACLMPSQCVKKLEDDPTQYSLESHFALETLDVLDASSKPLLNGIGS